MAPWFPHPYLCVSLAALVRLVASADLWGSIGSAVLNVVDGLAASVWAHLVEASAMVALLDALFDRAEALRGKGAACVRGCAGV